jgi:hypothetical protein
MSYALVIGAYTLAMAEAFYISYLISIQEIYGDERKSPVCGLNRQDIVWFFTFLAN